MAEEKPFHDPHVALNRIYTRRGDSGETSLVGGQRVPKDSLRIECYGTVDELNAFIGLARITAEETGRLDPLPRILGRVQHQLFNLGSVLATLPQDLHPNQPRILPADVTLLEEEMDRMNANLPPLRSFVLPGGCRLNAELHAARTICRRAEPIAVALARESEPEPSGAVVYLNRLSDALFVWSRWVNRKLGIEEWLWDPNQG